jgi:hypothetical protein
MWRRTLAVLLVAHALPLQTATAQDTAGFRWSVSTGPTMVMSGRSWFCSDGNQFSCSTSDLITGSQRGQHHLGLGVSRTIPGTALVLRADALYNRSASSPNSWSGTRNMTAVRSALRDDWYSLGLGLQWDARPGGAWSPYLLTSAGLAFNRIGWNDSDATSPEINRSTDQFGLFGALGAGMRVRVSRVELFSEVKRHYSPTLPGSRPVPFSFGIRF